MNREIKFRAYCKDSKKYLKGDFSIGIESSQFRGKYGEVFKNVDIEQFTGLSDKNGVELYEGDIVKFRGGRKPKGEERTYVNSVVVYKKCIFTVEENTSIFTDSAILNFCVVIGNIHDNSELLTKTN